MVPPPHLPAPPRPTRTTSSRHTLTATVFSPPSLRVLPTRHCRSVLAGLRLCGEAQPVRGPREAVPEGLSWLQPRLEEVSNALLHARVLAQRQERADGHLRHRHEQGAAGGARWPRGRAALQRDGDRGGLRVRPLPRRGLEGHLEGHRSPPKAQPWPATEDPVTAA
jgi:hypothetical protein